MTYEQVRATYDGNELKLVDVLAFIDHLSEKYYISDVEIQILKDNISNRERSLNAAADVLLEKYLSLKCQGYDSSMIIEIATERCFGRC